MGPVNERDGLCKRQAIVPLQSGREHKVRERGVRVAAMQRSTLKLGKVWEVRERAELIGSRLNGGVRRRCGPVRNRAEGFRPSHVFYHFQDN